MIRKNIEQALRQGSIKQKILLYMNDLAIFNTTYDPEKHLLTDKERTVIYRGLKTPQDIKYYNELRTWVKTYNFYNHETRVLIERVKAHKQALLQEVLTIEQNRSYRDIINELLDLYPEKDSREKALALALDKSELFKLYQEKGFSPYVVEDEDHDKSKRAEKRIRTTIDKLEEEAKGLRVILALLNQITEERLPLKPYKKDREEREEQAREELQQVKLMVDYINEELDCSLKITPYDEIELPEAYSVNSVNKESALPYE